MLPGQSHPIAAMGMQPGYAPMMQWEDPSGIPQQMIMMATPAGQQITMASVYPMPQNVMMSGQQRFVPPPPYSVQMASNFRANAVSNNDPQMNDEQRKKIEKEMKQRQFMDQQRRLQDLSAFGSVKVDPDKFIESFMGKSETAHMAPTAKPLKAESAKSTGPGEDVFGDFLSSSSVDSAVHQSVTAPPTTNVSSYLAAQQLQTLGKTALNASEGSAPSVASEFLSVNNAMDAHREKNDLASMIMQCSDLSAPKEAKRFEKRKSVNEVKVTKTVSVTYNESKAARHWNCSNEALSELFTLPVILASQPTTTVEAFEGRAASAVVSTEFRLPPWITGKIPIHSLYQKALDAVTRDGVILTELVYPLLLQSELPRDTLRYIWELCNRHTPGQLIREELFLILAMISIAQNGFDYSSLAILSKCPQSPVPNLGQFLSSPAPQQTTSLPGPAPGGHSVGSQVPAISSSTVSGTATWTSGMVELAQGTIPEPSPDPSIPPVPGDIWNTPGHVPDFGYTVHGSTVVSLPVDGFSSHPNTSSASAMSQSATDDDEFEEFQAAPLPSLGLSLSSVNAGTTAVHISSRLSNPPASHDKEFELMKMEEDKYAAFRDLSSQSSIDSKTDVASTALENPVDSIATDITIPKYIADSAPDVPLSAVSTFSNNSENLLQFHAASSSKFVIENDDMGEFASFGSQVKSDNSKSYALKPHINDPSDINAKPVGGLPNSPATSLSGKNVDDQEPLDGRAAEDDDGWAAFSSSGDDYISSQTNQNHSSGMVSGQTEPSNRINVYSKGLNQSHETEGWAEFESASSLRNDHVMDTKQFPLPSNGHAFPDRSKSIRETKDTTKTKLNAAANKVHGFFGQLNSNRVAPNVVGISPLDFHPPELPDEDDFATCPTYPKDGNSAAGISSLSVHYLEGNHHDSLSEEKNVAANINSSVFLGMTQSNSSNSLEFSGWKSGATVKEPDVHSTSSLELGHNKIRDFRDASPQQDGDSQSVSSLDFPQNESEQKSTADEHSVASFELKSASPESNAIPPEESRAPDEMPFTVDTLHSGFSFKESGQSHPIDLKNLLEQGSLGRFGDRYSELTNEVQDSDRHTYEWQRCLEICFGFLSEGNSVFTSLSSSSVLHEILSNDEGSTYLKGLVEIYFVSRRIEAEMRFVSVSNSKLVSILKDIDVEWSDVAAVCAGSPAMPDSSSLNFQSSFLKADDYEARHKSCGVCLLNVDIKTPDVSTGELKSRALSYGGRQYHTTCANFWINCVSKTLPSLTIPELL